MGSNHVWHSLAMHCSEMTCCLKLQVLLGDVPADVSGKRLGDGVLRSALINLGIIVTAAAATIGAEVTHRLPGAQSTHLAMALYHMRHPTKRQTAASGKVLERLTRA